MDDLRIASDACHAALESPELRKVDERLRKLRIHAGEELEKVTHSPGSVGRLERLAEAGRVDRIAFARWLLVKASLAAMPRIPGWRVSPSVRRLWADEVLYFAAPAGDLSFFGLDHVRFREMARIATLRRYPAGQFHWEIAGFPRSWLLRSHPRRWPGLLATLGLKLGGFWPMVEPHLNARHWGNRSLVTEPEGVSSFYRIARSVEMQPEIRGLLACSWLYCPETAAISPHLSWMRRLFVERGAFIDSIGPAPPDAGFLIGSEQRRKLYENGQYRPTITYVLWPRKAMLEWSRTLGEEPSSVQESAMGAGA